MRKSSFSIIESPLYGYLAGHIYPLWWSYIFTTVGIYVQQGGYISPINIFSELKKKELDYFPLNTDFIHDRAVRRLMKREGDSALSILVEVFRISMRERKQLPSLEKRSVKKALPEVIM